MKQAIGLILLAVLGFGTGQMAVEVFRPAERVKAPTLRQAEAPRASTVTPRVPVIQPVPVTLDDVEEDGSVQSLGLRGDCRVVMSESSLMSPRLNQRVGVLDRLSETGVRSRDLIGLSTSPFREGETPSAFELWRASDQVLDISARFYGDVLVALRDDAGLRIERWIFTDPDGAWTATRPEVLTPGPAATPAAIVEVKGGGDPPAEGAPAGQRTVRSEFVAAFPDAVCFRALSVDPDGRYFLVAWADRIDSFPLGASAELRRSFEVDRRLVHARTLGFHVMDHRTFGRVHYAEYGSMTGSPYDLAVIDEENDGIIDEVRLVDRGARQDAGPFGSKSRTWFGLSDPVETWRNGRQLHKERFDWRRLKRLPAVRTPERLPVALVPKHRVVDDLRAGIAGEFLALEGPGADWEGRRSVIGIDRRRSSDRRHGLAPPEPRWVWGAEGEVVAMNCGSGGDLVVALRREDELHVERWIFRRMGGHPQPVPRPTAHVLRRSPWSEGLRSLGVDPDGQFFLMDWGDRIERHPLDGSAGSRIVDRNDPEALILKW